MISRLYVGLAAAAVIAGALAYHFVTVSGLEGEVKTLEGAKEQLQAANLILTAENATCAANVVTQNKAVEDLRKDAENRAAAAAKAVADAERRAKASEALAAEIMGRPMAKPGDACGSLEVLIDEEIERRAK